MDLQIEKLQKDITGLMESSHEIENSSDILECLKNIQIRFISKLISKARAKIDFLEDRKKVKKGYLSVNEQISGRKTLFL